ncbi:long-chain-fatty-acid--CoA ligase [Methylobacterium sp. WSM2598]|uniref:long-chain-fatty-acid--CoA ligase n=1 Tax=Methylobacterium sp. WSM2598 TaxID=398261 RepID=UPI0003689C58|nr:long-chain-fatty-acid--CoA ligase [Methylobacterium sp. WSM2598]
MEYAKVTLPDLLQIAADTTPDAPAVVFRDRRMSYGQLFERARRLAGGLLGIGVKPGDHVGMMLPNWPEFLEVYFAASWIGAVIVPLSVQLRSLELEYVIGHAEITVLVVPDRFDGADYVRLIDDLRPKLPRIRHAVVVPAAGEAAEAGPGWIPYEALLSGPRGERAAADPDRVAMILYTSGTTGAPKGVMLSHQNMIWTAMNENRALEITNRDSLLLVVPFFHVFGAVVGIACAVAAGAAMVILDRFDAEEVLATIEEERCTVLYGTPTMFVLELNAPRFDAFDLTSLRTGMIAAAPCPVEVVKDIMHRMHCNVAVSYGLTETSPALTVTRFDDPPAIRAETVGRALPGIELRVVDETRRPVPLGTTGELACRGYAVMKGYYKDPRQTAEIIDADGWLYTGDLATLDAEGYVRIVGRKKDLIKQGGMAIFPSDIENYLYEHPAVEQVAIVGVPDEVLGERCRAYVKVRAGHDLTGEDVAAFCRDRIADYKIPRDVVFVETFPLTASGKIKKSVLREMARKGAARACTGSIVERVRDAAGPYDRKRIVREFLEAELAEVLNGRDRPARAAPVGARGVGFRDMGLKSLQAIQLRQRLSEALGDTIELSATVAFEFPTVEELSQHLLDAIAAA